MQCILREKLMEQAKKLAVVSASYQAESHRFVELYFRWLDEAEKDLSGLRSPISILLQGEKSSLTSVMDGYLPNQIQPGKSIRKSQKAAAAQSLVMLSKEIYSKIESIDNDLDQLREKLCHAIAVLASKESQLYGRLQVNQQGADLVWKMLAGTPETVPMYNYFCGKLASVDRDYLLMDIIQKIASNRTDISDTSSPSSKKNR